MVSFLLYISALPLSFILTLSFPLSLLSLLLLFVDSSNEMLDSQDNIFQSMRAKIHSEAEEVNEIMETIAALSKVG